MNFQEFLDNVNEMKKDHEDKLSELEVFVTKSSGNVLFCLLDGDKIVDHIKFRY